MILFKKEVVSNVPKSQAVTKALELVSSIKAKEKRDCRLCVRDITGDSKKPELAWTRKDFHRNIE